MNAYLKLEKYSIGVGDRFGQQAPAQLQACRLAEQAGVRVTPVWNKSHREHAIIGSHPSATRQAADAAVLALAWKHPYHVDADHVKHPTLPPFLPYCDYFTLDVGDALNGSAPPEVVERFIARHPELLGQLRIPGLSESIGFTRAELTSTLRTYLPAVLEAGALYCRIVREKSAETFITEVSMDETDTPQTPRDLLVILAALADEGVPAQAIAPKFAGRFNKGVDYVGDSALFAAQFEADLAVIAHAAREYGLPPSLKLSVHSGSDKFSLYSLIREAIQKHDAGLHLKTAGTTWLQELVGLTLTDKAGCDLVKGIYYQARQRVEELCQPYGPVISIDPSRLPSEKEVAQWEPVRLASAIAHDPSNPGYHPDLRQLLHVGYKIAAELGGDYLGALQRCRESISKKVTANLYNLHLKPLFLPNR
jgi:tagaturonate epimerase